MKTLTVLFAILVIFILTGCSDNLDTSPVSPQGNTTSLLKDSAVPFNSTYFGTGHITPTGPYSGSNVLEGRGNATHVGDYTSISNNDFYYTSATGGNIINGTHATYAPNGDEMFATFSGTFVVVNGIATNTINFIFNGGTGRFENLYGELQLVITSDDPGQLTQEYSGGGSGYIIY